MSLSNIMTSPCHGTHGWSPRKQARGKVALDGTLKKSGQGVQVVCPVGRTSSIDGCSGCGATPPTSSSRLTMRRMAMLNYHGHHGHPRVTGSPIGTWWDEGGPFMGHSQVFPRASSLTAVTIRRKRVHRVPVDVSGCLWSTRIIQSTRRINGYINGTQ